MHPYLDKLKNEERSIKQKDQKYWAQRTRKLETPEKKSFPITLNLGPDDSKIDIHPRMHVDADQFSTSLAPTVVEEKKSKKSTQPIYKPYSYLQFTTSMIKSIPEDESENFQPAWIITKEQAKEYQIKALRYQKYVEYKNSEEFRNLNKQEKF